MTRDLTDVERSRFQSFIRGAIMNIVPQRLRDDFLANYTCCPPPLFIPFVSAAEVCFLKFKFTHTLTHVQLLFASLGFFN